VGEAIKIAVTNRNFPFLAIYAFAVYGPMMGFQGLWAVPYMMDTFGWTKQAASNVLSWWAIGMICGCPIHGWVSDRVVHSRKKVVITGAVVYTLGWCNRPQPDRLEPGVDVGVLLPDGGLRRRVHHQLRPSHRTPAA
jgi:MFS family permease